MDALTRYEMIENDYMIQRMVLKIKTNQQSLFVIFDKVILSFFKKKKGRIKNADNICLLKHLGRISDAKTAHKYKKVKTSKDRKTDGQSLV